MNIQMDETDMATDSVSYEQNSDSADFSIDVLRHIERKLRAMRGVIMRRAGLIAAKETSGPVFRVSEDFVDRALRDAFNDGEEIQEIKFRLGLTRQQAESPSRAKASTQHEGRTEDFPFSSFRHLERKLRLVRGGVLRHAAKIAAGTDDSGTVGPVSDVHIDQALTDMLDHPDEIRSMLGLEIASFPE